MTSHPILRSPALDIYRREVLRWNKQINLVSRQNPAERLEELLQQSANGWEAIWREVIAGPVSAALQRTAGAAGDLLWYVDVGSGAGLPGFVWHLLLTERVSALRTWLVEPREKRAWFLKRLSSVCEAPGLEVASGRWGDVELPGLDDLGTARPWPPVVLVSLKALHLPDDEVLFGLARGRPVDSGGLVPQAASSLVVIARYYPGGQQLDSSLQRSLGLLPVSTPLESGHLNAIAAERGVLGEPEGAASGSSIVYSCYRL